MSDKKHIPNLYDSRCKGCGITVTEDNKNMACGPSDKQMTARQRAIYKSCEQQTVLEKRIIRLAKKWYDPTLTPCEYGRKCKKHAGVCQLLYAVSDLLDLESTNQCTHPKNPTKEEA